MRKLTAFIAGLLFGFGLLLAGMANPKKSVGFPGSGRCLGSVPGAGDDRGDWHRHRPLAWARQQTQSLLGSPMQLPVKRELDPRLIGGSLVFGIGWGIAGICPGPAVAILLTGHWQAFVFMLAMLAGMLLFTALETRRSH